MSHRIIVWALLGSLCLAGISSAMSSTNYVLDWNTLSGGGGFITSPSYTLQGVIGQIAGLSSSTNFRIQGGFLTFTPVPVIPASQAKIGVFRNGFWILDYNGNFQWNDVGTGNDLVAGFGAPGDVPVVKDWNGDGSPEIAVFRASAGQWIIDHTGNFQWDGTGAGQDVVASLGQTGDKPVAGDWDATGSDKIGIFRDGFWILDKNGNFQWDGPPDDIVAGFGMAGDIPVVADWNNDNRDNIGIFRNGFWILDYNGNFQWNDVGTGNDLVAGFGAPGDVPVVKDWNGDGSPEIAVFRASAGQWIIDHNGNFQWDGTGTGKDVVASLGQTGDQAVAGDWDATGSDKLGIFRDGFWILDRNGNFQWDGSSDDIVAGFGMAGDIPVVVDW